MELVAADAGDLSLHALLAVVIRQRIQGITEQVRTGKGNQDELIHKLRLVTKEFRAYLRLLRNPLSRGFRQREDKHLRGIARSLSGNRDSLVIRETLERLAHKCDKTTVRHSIHRMLIHLGEDRIPIALRAPSTHVAVNRLQTAAKALGRRLGSRLSDTQLTEALVHEYRRTRRLTCKVRRKPAVESWHRWRKQVKALHYQIRWLIELRPGRLSRLTRETWKLQALLGRHHDLHLTRDRVRRLRVDPINKTCREQTVRLIDRSLVRLEQRLRKDTRDFLKRSPREFAERLPAGVVVQ